MLFNKKIGIITQARMNSSRLPGKILLPLGQKTAIQHHVDRLKWSDLPIFIATTTNQSDDQIEKWAKEHSLPCYRGSELDVLSRFYGCAKENTLDIIVRVTSDCPLIDGHLIQEAVTKYLSWNDLNIYYSNSLERTFPRGFDFEIFSFQLLEQAYTQAQLTPEREHVTPYINQNKSGNVSVRHFKGKNDNSEYRLTLDTSEDYQLISKLFEEFDSAEKTTDEIIDIMKENPELSKINRHIEQKKV